jgi:hypothetical protein
VTLEVEHGPVSIPVDFGGLFGRAILGCVLVCGSMAAAIHGNPSDLFLKAISLICLVLFSSMMALATLAYVRLWRSGLPGLTLSSEGFVDSVVSPTLVRWSDVETCYLVKVFGKALLYVELKPGVIEKLWISRLLRFAYFRSHTLVFTNGYLDCNFNDLVKCFMTETGSNGASAVKSGLQSI